ncbi:sulfur carrier protein ThiS [Lentisphaerota bacterium WC36G]|nr:sulfur carrier protein ThiS [Lentisphaerae bacterium WC36]
MKIRANNKDYHYNNSNDEPKTLAEFLQRNGFECNKVLVALNDNIVKICDLESTPIKDNDVLDIMNFVGGG